MRTLPRTCRGQIVLHSPHPSTPPPPEQQQQADNMPVLHKAELEADVAAAVALLDQLLLPKVEGVRRKDDDSRDF